MKHLLLLITFLGFIINGIHGREPIPPQERDTFLIKIDALKKGVKELNEALLITNQNLKSIKRNQAKSVEKQNLTNDSIKSQLLEINQSIALSISSVENKLSESVEKSESRIDALKGSLSNNTIYWIIATSFAVLLVLTIFFFLKRSIKTNEEKTLQQLHNTRKILEEEGIGLDKKLLELLEKQLAIFETISKSDTSEEKDHSLALKVADELVRIQKNLYMMDDETKGKKQLSASVERIRSNFEAKGYEIVDMLNKQYHEGLNASVSFKEDISLENGSKIITRIIKPQVNYKNVMIQTAQIEVSQNI